MFKLRGKLQNYKRLIQNLGTHAAFPLVSLSYSRLVHFLSNHSQRLANSALSITLFCLSYLSSSWCSGFPELPICLSACLSDCIVSVRLSFSSLSLFCWRYSSNCQSFHLSKTSTIKEKKMMAKERERKINWKTES